MEEEDNFSELDCNGPQDQPSNNEFIRNLSTNIRIIIYYQ